MQAAAQSEGLEIELKFELTPAQARRLVRAPVLKALQTGRARSKVLQATYFDTPDHQLAERGMSLRVRKEGHVFVQCLKANAPDASITGFARHEWEWLVADAELDLQVLRADKDIKSLLKGIDFKKLTAIYTTDMRRQTREMTPPGGGLVLCELDQGKVMAQGRKTDVCELELEYVSGTQEGLLAVAQTIVDIVPCRLSNRTKAYRGHVLFENKGAPWITANHPPLPKNASGEMVLQVSVLEGLQHLIANEDCVLGRSHMEGVHQMRVATRRMRSIITTYKKLLPKGRYEDLSGALKACGAALGPARDWDVFVAEVMAPVINGFDRDPALELMEKLARNNQDHAYAQAHQMIRSPVYAKLLIDALVWGAQAGWKVRGKTPRKLSAPATQTAKAILTKRHDQLLQTGQGLVKMSVKQRHFLRIAVKKARYTAAFFAELYPNKRTKPYLKALKGLQESLGYLNDLATAEMLMGELCEGLEPDELAMMHRAQGRVQGWYMHAQSLREDDLRKAWKGFKKLKQFW